MLLMRMAHHCWNPPPRPPRLPDNSLDLIARKIPCGIEWTYIPLKNHNRPHAPLHSKGQNHHYFCRACWWEEGLHPHALSLKRDVGCGGLNPKPHFTIKIFRTKNKKWNKVPQCKFKWQSCGPVIQMQVSHNVDLLPQRCCPSPIPIANVSFPVVLECKHSAEGTRVT